MSLATPFAYVLQDRKRVVRIAGWSVGDVLGPLLTGRFIANAIDAASAGALSAAFGWLAGLLLAGGVGVWSLRRVSWLAADAAADVQLALSRDVVRESLGDAVRSDRVLRSGAELTQHVPVLVDILALLLRTAPGGLFALGAVAGLATISWPLLALVAPWLVLSMFLLAALIRRDAHYQTAAMLAGEASYGEMTKALQGVRDLMAAGAKGFARARIGEHIRAVNQALLRQTDQHALRSGAVHATATWLPAVTALAFVPFLVRGGDLTPGEVVGSFTYLLAGLSTATTFVTAMASYAVVLRVRHGRLLESSDETRPAVELVAVAAPPSPPALEVRDLAFAYGASAAPIVENLNLSLAPGDHVAVVGPSGIGKSSLAALLAGVLVPDRGSVTIGGTPLHQREDRCQLVTMVPQETYVFAGSLRENLCYLRPSATDAEVLAAAQAVGLERVLERLGGLEGEIDLAKSALSAGERQLVTLVRAHLAASPIVVLDEATCHLDPAAEERAERAFMASGSTLVVVAHRMSATLRAKRVLVMGGEGVDVGEHSELLRRNALYSDFHAMWSPSGTERSLETTGHGD